MKLLCEAGLDDWTTQLVAVCADGAALNIGIYTNILLKLRQHTFKNCKFTPGLSEEFEIRYDFKLRDDFFSY